MTGFGVASRPWAEGPGGRPHQLVVELRGVNQRFRELKIRQPFGPKWEHLIRQRIEAQIGRGRIDVAIFLQRQGDDARAAGIDRERLAEVLAGAREVAALAAQQEVELAPFNVLELLSFVSASARSSGGPTEATPAPPSDLLDCVDEALLGLIAMRVAEGEALAEELGALLDGFEAQVAELREAIAGESERLEARLTERVAAVCARAGVEPPDPARIVQEVAILVQKADIAEELARIASHVAQMRGVIASEAQAGDGKRLDFLCQELFREITTIGSKISSHRGSGLAVAAKGSVERIREQVQNVE
ncbi:MAG: YicC family protein [Myxococcales bacterium]|nr:YicC family protein [Myxococcales bacterium]